MPVNEPRTYLGIDPGLGITGYGVLRFSGSLVELIEAGTVRSSGDDLLHLRLNELYNGIMEIIENFDPDVMGIEKLYSHYAHPVTAIKMAHARGVFCLAAVRSGIELISLPATRIKKLVTGNGRASKQQVSGMVRHLLGLSEEIRPMDVTDALAAAIAAHESEKNAGKYKRIRRKNG